MEETPVSYTHLDVYKRQRKGYVLPGQMKLLNSAETVTACISRMPLCCVAAIDWKRPAAFSRVFSGREEKFEISSRSISSYNNSFEALVKDLKRYKKTGSRVLLLSGSRTRARRLAQDLRDEELVAVYSEDPYREVQPGEVLILSLIHISKMQKQCKEQCFYQ